MAAASTDAAAVSIITKTAAAITAGRTARARMNRISSRISEKETKETLIQSDNDRISVFLRNVNRKARTLWSAGFCHGEIGLGLAYGVSRPLDYD